MKNIEAFKRAIALIYPKPQKVWFKLGHDRFFVGEVNSTGNFCLYATKGNRTNRVTTELIEDGFEYLRSQSELVEGGVFYIPTNAEEFPLKEYIHTSQDVSTEFDFGTSEEQLEKINWFTANSGLVAAFTTTSGGKSLHPHWLLDEAINIKEASYLDQLLCIATMGDPAVVNPHQPMRFPGFYRKEKQGEQELIQWCDRRYSYEEFLSGFKKAFAALELPFPDEISENRWREIKKAIRLKRDYGQIRTVLNQKESDFLPVYRNSSNFNSFDSEELVDRLITDALSVIPQRIKGQNTYEYYLKVATVLKSRYGEERAIALLEQHSPSNQCGWNIPGVVRAIHKDLPPPVLFNVAKELGGWTYPQWAKEELRQQWIAVHQKQIESRLELDDQEYQEFVAAQTEQELIETELEPKKNFFDWLRRQLSLGLCPTKYFGSGFQQMLKATKPLSMPNIIHFKQSMVLPSPNQFKGVIRFKPKQRLKVIATAKNAGWKFIHDKSFMGLGKSHDLGLLEPDNYQVMDANSGEMKTRNGEIWYLDLNHRNPSVATIEQNFTDLPIKHNGLYHNHSRQTALGHPFLVTSPTQDNQEVAVSSNCINAELFYQLKEKGYDPDFSEEERQISGGGSYQVNSICARCPFFKQKGDNGKPLCSSQVGEGYGFRKLRKEAISTPKKRAHIEQLAPDYDYQYSTLVIEEAGQLIKSTKQIDCKLADWDKQWGELETKFPEFFKLLAPVRIYLRQLLDSSTLPYHGYDHEHLMAELSKIIPNPNQWVKEVRDWLPIIKEESNLSKIFVDPDSCNFDGLDPQLSLSNHEREQLKKKMAYARYYFRREAWAQSCQNLTELPSNFLIPLLEILTENNSNPQGYLGVMRISSKPVATLSITIRKEQQEQIIKNSRFVIFLDSTAKKDWLGDRLNILSDSILQIEQEPPSMSNLNVEVINVKGLGSSQASETALQRAIALTKKLETKHSDLTVLGLKKWQNNLKLDGWWFAHNRGTNELKGKTAIAAFGSPNINVGAALDEYLILHGNTEGFDEYYQQLTESEYLQLIGRARHHHYLHQQFTIYLIGSNINSDFLSPLNMNHRVSDGFSWTPEAGTQEQQNRWKIWQIAQQLHKLGEKVTQKAIANILGISQGRVSQILKESPLGDWRGLKKLLGNLLSTNSRKTNNLDSESDKLLAMFLESDVECVVETVIRIIHEDGWLEFAEWLESFSAQIQCQLVAIITNFYLLSKEAIA